MILGVSELHDSDLIGFLHRLQECDERIAKWSDAAVIKVRDNYKHILKEAEFISESGTTREIVRPIIRDVMNKFLPEQGGGKLMPEGIRNPGQIYSVARGKSGMIGVFRLESQMHPGNGKFERTGIGSDRDAKEATNTAFNF